MNHVIEHCGNFSADVLEGLIGYGREKDKGPDKKNANPSLPEGDGYATKEGDILLGGFLRILASKKASEEGERLSELGTREKERLALHVARRHLDQFGAVNTEHYQHWMKRVRAFAKHQRISLPERNKRESDHRYFQKVRKWVKDQPGSWPELKKAAGTHLVFSPDPKIWQNLRARGMDERDTLKTILSRTMKDFSDFRRKEHGIDHTLGWVAGTHVHANGADRHPHIHLVVLKRDESGKEVDWSVSNLKGRAGKSDPDPLKELKRLFEKNVEKEIARTPEVAREPRPDVLKEVQAISAERTRNVQNTLRALNRTVRLIATQGRSSGDSKANVWNDLGKTLRFIAVAQKNISETRRAHQEKYPELDLRVIAERLREAMKQLQVERRKGIEIEP
jgi:hypothetical protein